MVTPVKYLILFLTIKLTKDPISSALPALLCQPLALLVIKPCIVLRKTGQWLAGCWLVRRPTGSPFWFTRHENRTGPRHNAATNQHQLFKTSKHTKHISMKLPNDSSRMSRSHIRRFKVILVKT